jgi:uncharacterized damage-inducible protein DinB
MAKRLAKPPQALGDTKLLFLAYLDQYRSIIADKLAGLSDNDLRNSRLPSGWTPIELLKHLVFMERRWFRWGFAAEQVDAPWGDNRDGVREAPWYVGPDERVEDLIAALDAGGERTREIVESADLTALAAPGGRFDEDGPRPTLNWILFHVFQEYARHAGHLDIARELADGRTGE